MARIIYSLAGEGRGHATRVKSVVEQLRRRHSVVLLAPGIAYDLLASAYDQVPQVVVHSIPGLHFQYRNNRLEYLKSIRQALPFVWSLPAHVAAVERLIQQEQPDLAITDFEPILPRAAERCGLPYISFDHQHFLLANDLSSLPITLRWKAWFLSLSINRFYRRQRRTVISSFYAPPLRRGHEDTEQVGVLLRPEILQAHPIHGSYLLVYMRRVLPQRLRDALQGCGREVRIYGVGRQPDEGNLKYREVDEEGFLQDLIGCDALVSNAGNQLVGEAMYLGKPVLAFPESGNFEQAINAHFLHRSGAGQTADMAAFTLDDLRRFLERLPDFRGSIVPDAIVGNQRALAVIEQEVGAILAARPAVPSAQAA